MDSCDQNLTAVQHLYDGDKTRWRFVLCGGSARKLRRIGANLLPGRSFYHRLLPLTLVEHPKQAKQGYIVCRCSRPAQIHDQITALPWFCL